MKEQQDAESHHENDPASGFVEEAFREFGLIWERMPVIVTRLALAKIAIGTVATTPRRESTSSFRKSSRRRGRGT